MKRIPSLTILVVLLTTSLFYNWKLSNNPDNTTNHSKQRREAPAASFNAINKNLSKDVINCEFKIISNFTFQNADSTLSNIDRKIYYETTPESTPNLITFAGLTTKQPKMKGNVGEVNLITLKDDDETIMLAEKLDTGEIFTYTIFKKEKVAVWSKAYTVLTTPFGMVSMGYCY